MNSVGLETSVELLPGGHLAIVQLKLQDIMAIFPYTLKIHIQTATLDADTAAHTLTLMAPSKTFNLPGLGCSFAVISDKNLRGRFKRAMAGIVPMVNLFGLRAAEVAFRDCSDWHAALLDYLRGNRRSVEKAVNQMPYLSMAPVEATYLAWLDARDTGLRDPAAFFDTRRPRAGDQRLSEGQ